MRIVHRVAERRGHPLHQLLRRRMLEPLRLVVHPVPRIAEHLGEIALEDAMTTERAQRSPTAVAVRRTPRYGSCVISP